MYDPPATMLDEYRETNKIRSDVMRNAVTIEENVENTGSIINGWECPRCHENRGFLYTKQTRSADEGMTQFIRCSNCGRETRIAS
jgi:DNA-directed RNA polymerase subunit M/transcription elongation factor TFIIS